ncbi:MAG: hypothetical protein IJP96_10950 [Synergistaceae bacterium]|nr:hypothetical protein [Synergistaceae bacterium]
MTKNEVYEIINATATKYGFEMQDTYNSWYSKQNSDSYVRVEIFKNMDYKESDSNNIILCFNIEPVGSVCQMGKRTDAKELLRIAQDIERGAKFVAEIEALKLSYVEKY